MLNWFEPTKQKSQKKITKNQIWQNTVSNEPEKYGIPCNVYAKTETKEQIKTTWYEKWALENIMYING